MFPPQNSIFGFDGAKHSSTKFHILDFMGPKYFLHKIPYLGFYETKTFPLSKFHIRNLTKCFWLHHNFTTGLDKVIQVLHQIQLTEVDEIKLIHNHHLRLLELKYSRGGRIVRSRTRQTHVALCSSRKCSGSEGTVATCRGCQATRDVTIIEPHSVIINKTKTTLYLSD